MSIKNIKVVATYEESPNSDIEALITQYELAKEVTKNTKATIQPLIDASAKRKLELIVASCKDVYACAQKVNPNMEIRVSCIPKGKCIGYAVDIFRDKMYLDGHLVEFDEDSKPIMYAGWEGENGIVTNWNKLDIISRMKQYVKNYITVKIKNEEAEAQSIRNTYTNMINN